MNKLTVPPSIYFGKPNLIPSIVQCFEFKITTFWLVSFNFQVKIQHKNMNTLKITQRILRTIRIQNAQKCGKNRKVAPSVSSILNKFDFL